MHAMHYRITLPADYAMQTIRKRVQTHGHLTDGFQDLLFKTYLITEKDNGAIQNRYCPLYLWQDSAGMNKFIFEGYFDNILRSFGWQYIETGIPEKVMFSARFRRSRYVLAEEVSIPARTSLQGFPFPESQPEESGLAVVYQPDKWRLATFRFYEEKPATRAPEKALYEILHLSVGDQLSA